MRTSLLRREELREKEYEEGIGGTYASDHDEGNDVCTCARDFNIGDDFNNGHYQTGEQAGGWEQNKKEIFI